MEGLGALGARKADVLRAVVRDYIRTAEPVASASLAARHRLGVSPATLRNDMAALEDMGYLTQPHTSAGRIPTDRGYRFYVDALPRRPVVSEAQRRAIVASFRERLLDMEEVVRRTAMLLSQLTRYAAVALPPLLRRSRVVRAELVPVGAGALLLVVTDAGRVHKHVVELTRGAARGAVRRVSTRLEGAPIGLTLHEAVTVVSALAEDAPEPDRALLRAVARRFEDLAEGPGSEHVVVGGMANIAGEEGFERRDTLRRLVEALEEEEASVRRFLLGAVVAGDVVVHIGSENPLQAMREASVVVAPYRAGGEPAGTLAVIGPTRMQYPTTIAAVREVARELSGVIEGLAG